MKDIALLSDTHGFFDPDWVEWLSECQEIWHAGDIGELDVTRRLAAIAPLRAVYGNIDGTEARQAFPEHNRFTCDGVQVWITHIGPPRSKKTGLRLPPGARPDIFICGHSHLPRAEKDAGGTWHLNPGACGRHGFHQQRTAMKLRLEDGKLSALRLLELGSR